MKHEPPEILDVVPAPPGFTCEMYGSASEDVHDCQRKAQYLFVYDQNSNPEAPVERRNALACAECFRVPDDYRQRAAGFTDSGFLPTAARCVYVGIIMDGDRDVFHTYDYRCTSRPVGDGTERITPWAAVTHTTPELLAESGMRPCLECLQASAGQGMDPYRSTWATVKYLRERGLAGGGDGGDG